MKFKTKDGRYAESTQISEVFSLTNLKLLSLVIHFLLLPGDFTEGHPASCWSQCEYGTSPLPDLSNNPWGFDTRRGVPQLQTERCCWWQKCWFALEGETLSWAQRGGCRIRTEPCPFLSLAHRSSPLALSRAELLAPHGQWFQRLYVAVGSRARGEGQGQRQGWDTNTLTRSLFAWWP